MDSVQLDTGRLLDEVLKYGSEEERLILHLTAQSIWARRTESAPYLRTHFGLDGRMVADDRYVLEAEITPYMLNFSDYVHGGMIAYVADTALGILTHNLLQPGGLAVTSGLNIHYIAPGEGKRLIADAQLLHLGKRTVVAECKLHNDAGVLIASVTGTFAVIRPKQE